MIRRNFIKKAALTGTAFSVIPSSLFSHKDTETDKINPPFNFRNESLNASDISILPQETDQILSNPGVGWQTFGRMAKMDKNLPSWIPSTVSYFRWGWDKLEPKQGQIDQDFLNGFLNEARECGQTLAFRVMTAYPGRKVYPDWLKETGGKINYTEVFIDNKNSTDCPVPDFDDEKVLKAHNDFIKMLGSLYDGHPDIDHIDMGSAGWWGEWHLSGAKNVKMPLHENLKKVVDSYVNAFRKTPLVIPIGASQFKILEYATGKGAGWRADCFGDMNYHMLKYYTQALTSSNALGAWKKGPVAWESCWDARKWVTEGWPLRFIFNYGLALHGSVINNKSAILPEGEEVQKEIKRFLQRLGYRFVLKELRHPLMVKAGKLMDLSMKWKNIGSAPCYKPYKLAYKLSSGSEKGKQEKVIISTVTVDRWMPGDMELNVQDYLKNPVDLPPGEIYDIKDSIIIPGDIKPGKYTLSLAVTGVAPENEGIVKPVVQLGIEGKKDDGWYKLSEITIDR
jgi:hypothetical protein